MRIGRIFAFCSSVRERRLVSTFRVSLALRLLVAGAAGEGAGACDPDSSANAIEPANKASNVNTRIMLSPRCIPILLSYAMGTALGDASTFLCDYERGVVQDS